ncbi:MAG: hypothetical protein H0U70_02855 [Tatlockia sp.]|nr:hypothetical protein [Tatlockia sp.]
MAFYELIKEKLNQADIHYDIGTLSQTAILEYVVFEAADCLASLQGKPLVCAHRAFSEINSNDGISRTVIDLRLAGIDFKSPDPIIKNSLNEFSRIVSLVEKRLIGSSNERLSNSPKGSKYLYSVIIPDEIITQAINSSSLLIAAGDLGNYDFEALLKLREKLAFYINSDSNIEMITKLLTNKITTLLENKFPDEYKIESALEIKKNQFNLLLNSLQIKINELKTKGDIESLTFNENYAPVAAAAHGLAHSLKDARDEFFSARPTKNSLTKFKSSCTMAIQIADEEFVKFRGGIAKYFAIYPLLEGICRVCRAILGILAGVTLLPALVTSICAPQGYLSTFFYTKTNSKYNLDLFEQGLKENVYKELDEITEALSLR